MCTFQSRGLIWSSQVGFPKNLPGYGPIASHISGCPALRRKGWKHLREAKRWTAFWWAGSNSWHLHMQLPLSWDSVFLPLSYKQIWSVISLKHLCHTLCNLCVTRPCLYQQRCDQICSYYGIGSVSHTMIRQKFKSFVIRQEVNVTWETRS